MTAMSLLKLMPVFPQSLMAKISQPRSLSPTGHLDSRIQELGSRPETWNEGRVVSPLVGSVIGDGERSTATTEFGQYLPVLTPRNSPKSRRSIWHAQYGSPAPAGWTSRQLCA